MAAVSKRCIEYMGEVCKKSIHVKNIPENVSYTHVYEEFKQFGNVVNITLPVFRNTNQPKGYAFIEYLNEDEAANALLTKNGCRLWGRILAISYSRGRPKSAREMAMRNALRDVKQKQARELLKSNPPNKSTQSDNNGESDVPPDEQSNGDSDKNSNVGSSGSRRSRTRSSRSTSSSSSSGSSTSSSSSSRSSSDCRRSRSPRNRSTSSSSSEESISRRRRRCTRHRRSRCSRRSRHHRHRHNRSSKTGGTVGGGKTNAGNGSADCISKSNRCLHSHFPTAHSSYRIFRHLSNRLSDTRYFPAICDTCNVWSANIAVQLEHASVSVSDHLLCRNLAKADLAVFQSFQLAYSLCRAKEISKHVHHLNHRTTGYDSQNSIDPINMSGRAFSALTGEKFIYRAADVLTVSLAQILKELLMSVVAAVSSQQYDYSNVTLLVILLRYMARNADAEPCQRDYSDPRSWIFYILLGLERHRRELAWGRRCSYSVSNRQNHRCPSTPVLLH